MSEEQRPGAGLDAEQRVRLRRARVRWGLSIVVVGLAITVLVHRFFPHGSSHDPSSPLVFGVVFPSMLALVLPWSQFPKAPARVPSPTYRLVVLTDPADLRRVKASLRRGDRVEDADDVVIAQALVHAWEEQLKAGGLLIGLSMMAVLGLAIAARLQGQSVPWLGVAVAAAVAAASSWWIVARSRLLSAVRAQVAHGVVGS